jgi:heat shock protein HslJ
MKKSIYFAVLLFTILSCKTTSTATNTVNTEENSTILSSNSDKKPYFKASGTEPFWSIHIYEDKIVYKTPEDSIFLPHSDPIMAMDSNVKLYKTKTKYSEFNIQISQQECTNQMSGEIFPYKVSVDFKKNASSNFEKINGCGQYIIDYRLHDIWVLEELNGNKVIKEDFTNMLPVLEIFKNLNSYKFSGLLGCNRIMSSLFFEREKLRFTSISSTKMMCGNSNKEAELITALESVTTYSIGDNRLILSNPSGKKIILKKID